MDMPSTDTRSLQALLSDVLALGQQLPAVLQAREADFLSLGQGLMEFRAQARAMVQGGMGLQGLCQDQSTRQGLEDMSRFLEGQRQGQDDTALLQALAGLGSKAKGLDSGCHDFLRVLRGLHFLGVATRVESSRLGSAGLSFVTLAEDVEHLVERIRVALEGILADTSATVRGIAQAQKQTAGMLATLQAELNQAKGAFTQGLQKMADLDEESGRLAGNISDLTRGIADDVERVVGAMQFHDIVRQQLEHVGEILDEANKAVVQALETGGSAGELAAGLADVCGLQERQVAQAQGFFEQAGGELASGLENIAERLRELVTDLERFASLDGGLALADEVQRQLGRTRDMLARAAESRRQTTELVSGLGSTMQGMHSHLEDIESIGAEIKLIALNAIIKAAGAGHEGRALAAIAGEIQALSGSSQHLADGVRRTLVEITEVAAELERLQGGGQGGAEAMQPPSLCAMNEETRTLAATVLDAGKAGMVAIAQGLERLGLRRDIARELDGARRRLETLRGTASRLAPPGGRRSDLLDGLVSKYTMESERQVHWEHQGGGQAAAGRSAPPGNGAGEDQWDNVELF